MLCFFVRRLIEAYLGDALRERDAGHLRRHCEECAPCAEAVRQAVETARLVATLPRRSLSKEDASALLARVRAQGRARLGERLLGTPAPLPYGGKSLAARALERWDALKHAAILLGFRACTRPAMLPAYAALPVAALLLVVLYRGTPNPETIAQVSINPEHLEVQAPAETPTAPRALEQANAGESPSPSAGAREPGAAREAKAPAISSNATPRARSSRPQSPRTPSARLRVEPRKTPPPTQEAPLAASAPGEPDRVGATAAPSAPAPTPMAFSLEGERSTPPMSAAGVPQTMPDLRQPTAVPPAVAQAPPAAESAKATAAGEGAADSPARMRSRSREAMALQQRPGASPLAAPAPSLRVEKPAHAGGEEVSNGEREQLAASAIRAPADTEARKEGRQASRSDSPVAAKPPAELIRRLRGTPEEAQEAARELGRRGEKSAVEALGRLLRAHAHAEVREAAAQALLEIGTREALALLRSVAESEGPGKAAAARALERQQ
jgi:hypothetical protein